MPRPGLVGASRAQQCPLVGLVGACCSGCAEGKGCGAKEELHAHAAVQARVGETAIPWDDVEKTNATIDHVQEAAATLAGAPQGSPEFQRFMLWSLFYSTWHIWYVATKAEAESQWTFTPGVKIVHGPNADTYKTLVLAFNEQLAALDALQVKASADPIDTRSPAGKAFDATVKGVLDGTGGALGGIATVLTYAAVAGVVGLGLYFAGPPLLSLIMRKGKK